MRRRRFTPSRWFIYGSTGLLVFLCLAVLLAGLILIRRSMQPRSAQIVGSSMEPSLRGPRVAIGCSECGFRNQFTADSWREDRPIKCLCCRNPLEINEAPEILEGQRIEYLPIGTTDRWPTFRKRPGPLLQRWDPIVIRKGPEQPSEVKRIVGLPGESVKIQDGDLWINGDRIHRHPSEFLKQAILIAHWQHSEGVMALAPWLRTVPVSFDNVLATNAHDSHAIVSASDFGVALRILDSSPRWTMNAFLNTPDGVRELRLDVTDSQTLLSVPGTKIRFDARDAGWNSPWIILSCIDEHLHVSDDRSTLFSLPLSSLKTTETEQVDAPKLAGPFSFELAEGTLAFDRSLIFRGIVYRGYGDMPMQSFPDGDGYLVLGDNVSISEDSRGAGDASIRVTRQEIRGVILPDDVDLANLLRQTASVPGGNCRENNSLPDVNRK